MVVPGWRATTAVIQLLQNGKLNSLLLQLKHGEIHSTVQAAAVLTDTQYALEVQMSAYTLLQILVRGRGRRSVPAWECRAGVAALVFCSCCRVLVVSDTQLVGQQLNVLLPQGYALSYSPCRVLRVCCALQVRNRWTELSGDEQQKITQLAYQHMKDGA